MILVLGSYDEMPEHNTASAKKKAPAAGGAGTRSSTGQKLGRRAARAVVKGGEVVDTLLSHLECGQTSIYLTLGRVERVFGGSHFEVRLLNGEAGRMGLGGNIRNARGGCCITLNDFVVVDGGVLKGRLSAAEAQRARRAVEKTGIRVKKGFFAIAQEDGGLAEEDDDLFDRSDEERAEEAEKAARKAAAAEAAEKLARTRVLLPGRRAAVPLVAVAEKEEPVDAEEDDEEEPVDEPTAVKKPALPAGPNRAERRAAARIAAEMEEAAAAFARSKAEDEAYMRQLESGVIEGAVWSDDDEINVDAI